MTKENHVPLKQPLLIIGIGGAGSRIAMDASQSLNCKCMLISNDKNDLDINYHNILIDSHSWINPSSYKIRSLMQSSIKRIRSAVDGFQTIIIITNLAGRSGTAMSPIISRIAKQSGASAIILFAIMPFGFEKDRLFHAGISLKRLQDIADVAIVIDNDTLLENNPELSPRQCYEITNNAICDVISTILEDIHPKMNLLIAGKKEKRGSVESSIKDSIEMLYDTVHPKLIKRALLYVIGGKNVPIGKLNFITRSVESIFAEEKTPEVVLNISDSETIKVHLMATVHDKTRFDKYDPLSEIIPEQNVLDWEELDSSPDIEMVIQNLE